MLSGDALISVKVSINDSTELSKMLLRQTSGGSGIWNGCRFYINQPVERCDWWIVCHGSALQEAESTLCDPEHLVYISMEPSEQWVPSAFHRQFSKLILCDREKKHRDIIYANGLTWWVGFSVEHKNKRHEIIDTGRLDYDCLKAMTVPNKMDRISVMYSSTNTIPGHQKRLEFLENLHAHPISDHIDFFGGGYAPIADKWDAIAPYRYHLAIENSLIPDYWTEKLADPLLGFALPIYYGCPNINNYFDSKALHVIDIDDFDGCVAVLESLFTENIYEQRIEAINHARQQVLEQYNIFQMMADICDKPAQQMVRCKLNTVAYYNQTLPKKFFRRVRRILS